MAPSSSSVRKTRPVYPSGWSELDNLLGGGLLSPGLMTLVVGEGQSDKTQCALYTAYHPRGVCAHAPPHPFQSGSFRGDGLSQLQGLLAQFREHPYDEPGKERDRLFPEGSRRTLGDMLELRLELPEEETRSGIGFFLTWDSAILRDRLERATDTTLRQRIG
eukprot:scaffold1434_cov208-Ochromonas_danica.AAC.1